MLERSTSAFGNLDTRAHTPVFAQITLITLGVRAGECGTHMTCVHVLRGGLWPDGLHVCVAWCCGAHQVCVVEAARGATRRVCVSVKDLWPADVRERGRQVRGDQPLAPSGNTMSSTWYTDMAHGHGISFYRHFT